MAGLALHTEGTGVVVRMASSESHHDYMHILPLPTLSIMPGFDLILFSLLHSSCLCSQPVSRAVYRDEPARFQTILEPRNPHYPTEPPALVDNVFKVTR